MPGVLSLDAEGNARALELLERAMDRDPDHALATALAAWAHVQRVVYHFTVRTEQERARSIELAHKARALSGDATRAGRARQRADAARRARYRGPGRSQGARGRRRIGLGVEPQRMARRLSGRSAIRHRALQDRARPRAARFAGLQQPGRDRLRAFQGRQLCRRRQAGRSGRWSSIRPRSGCIEPCARPMCWPGPAGGSPQPRRAAASNIPI